MRALLGISLVTIFTATSWGQASFRLLGGSGYPVGDVHSHAISVSNGGTVVVGYRQQDGARDIGWYWDSTGMHDILGTDNEPVNFCRDISADGTTIVGNREGRAFRWTMANGFQNLGGPNGPNGNFDVTHISADGTTIVGGGRFGDPYRAARWTIAGQFQQLGEFPAGYAIDNPARGVSGDGSVIVGTGQGPFRWISSVFYSLDNLYPYNVSADGNVIIGDQNLGGDIRRAVRWSFADGITPIGVLPGASGHTTRDISGDGNTIVGDAGFGTYNDSFIWMPQFGIRHLKTYLFEAGAINVSGLHLYHASGISPDGRYVVGEAVHSDGRREAYLAGIGATISGRIFFSNLDRYAYAPTPIEFELREPGGGTPFQTIQTPLLANDTFDLRGLPARALDLSVKPTHWLRKTISLDTTNANTYGLNIALQNGDVVDDNEVNLVDFGALAAAFGSVNGDPNWNAMADLDGDEEVNLLDLGILSANFGLAGDE